MSLFFTVGGLVRFGFDCPKDLAGISNNLLTLQVGRQTKTVEQLSLPEKNDDCFHLRFIAPGKHIVEVPN